MHVEEKKKNQWHAPHVCVASLSPLMSHPFLMPGWDGLPPEPHDVTDILPYSPTNHQSSLWQENGSKWYFGIYFWSHSWVPKETKRGEAGRWCSLHGLCVYSVSVLQVGFKKHFLGICRVPASMQAPERKPTMGKTGLPSLNSMFYEDRGL